VLDRVAVDLQRQSRAGKMDVGATQLNLLGLSMEDARPVFEALGYVAEEEGETLTWKWGGRPKTKPGGARKGKPGRKPGKAGKPRRKNPKPQKIDEDSPFAKLRELKLS